MSSVSEPTEEPTEDSELRATRKALGLRLVDVAAGASCSVGMVSMVENGYRPSLDMRGRIAAAVGASAGSFWPGTPR